MEKDMNQTLFLATICVASALVAGCPAWIFYLVERRRRKKSEESLVIVRDMGKTDDLIFYFKTYRPRDWPWNDEAQKLIARREKLHERYCKLMGFRSIVDLNYVNDLVGPDVSSK